MSTIRVVAVQPAAGGGILLLLIMMALGGIFYLMMKDPCKITEFLGKDVHDWLYSQDWLTQHVDNNGCMDDTTTAGGSSI